MRIFRERERERLREKREVRGLRMKNEILIAEWVLCFFLTLGPHWASYTWTFLRIVLQIDPLFFPIFTSCGIFNVILWIETRQEPVVQCPITDERIERFLRLMSRVQGRGAMASFHFVLSIGVFTEMHFFLG